jgi:pimeloyl-ACP methyl ester carboxylesterase
MNRPKSRCPCSWRHPGVIVFVVLVTAVPWPRPERVAVASEDTSARMFRVDVGGYKLYLECMGTGSPTVVMSSNFVERWERVQPRVAQYTRACAYDRAGMGMSDAGHLPTTVEQLAGELRRLLVNGRIAGPYILVGEGLDGSGMQMYASLYPASLAGLVLVDAIPAKDFWNADAALFGLQNIDLRRSRMQLRKADYLGDLPLVVVSHGVYLYFPRSIERSWRRVEHGLTKLSADSVHAIALHSNYGIPEAQPEIVVEAVDQMLLAGRAHRPLLRCALWLPSAGAACPIR